MDSSTDLEREVRARCVKSLMELVVLTALKNARMCGYGFITFVYDRFRVLLSPGTVYPSLESLRSKGLITEEQTERKKIYTLTRKGEAVGSYLLSEYERVERELQCHWYAAEPGQAPNLVAPQSMPPGNSARESKEELVAPL